MIHPRRLPGASVVGEVHRIGHAGDHGVAEGQQGDERAPAEIDAAVEAVEAFELDRGRHRAASRPADTPREQDAPAFAVAAEVGIAHVHPVLARLAVQAERAGVEVVRVGAREHLAPGVDHQ